MKKHRALVCGASQGIGRAIAWELAAQGLSVTAFARSEEKLAELIKDLPAGGHDYIAGDIGESANWLPKLAEKNQDRPYGVLILNSGGPPSAPISAAQPEDFLQAMRNHLVANSLMVQTCLERMKKDKFGRILTITSTSVKMPIPHLGVSNTARAAVAAWAKTLSFEVAPFGITVNNVMPGFTETPRLEKLIEAQAKASSTSPEQVRAQWLKTVPSGRFCRPEETAALVGFLASEKAGAITGQSIAVDGGRLGCL